MTTCKKLILLTYLSLAGFLIFLAIDRYVIICDQLKFYNANSLDIIDQRMQSIFTEINDFPGGAASDLLFLSRLSCLRHRLVASTTLTATDKAEITKDFLEFLKQNSVYYQLNYFDRSGREIIRTEFNEKEGNYQVAAESQLVTALDEVYLSRILTLKPGEVLVSPLVLNVKDGVIENRGNENNPQYVPVIRYSTQVFSPDQKPLGLISVSVYADYFLGDIRRSRRDGEITFLINSAGYYLAHPMRAKEFAFLFEDNKANFFTDYPDAKTNHDLVCDNRHFETDDYIFSYRCVYPLVNSFEVFYDKSNTLDQKDQSKNYHWTLVAVTPKKAVQKDLKDYLVNFFWFLAVCFSLISLIIFLLIRLMLAGNVKSRSRPSRCR